MSDLLSILFYLGSVVCWFKAVIVDITQSNLAWILIDFFLAPIGVIRGFILFLT